MTVGDLESGAEGREQNCVKFYGTVYRQQSEIDPLFLLLSIWEFLTLKLAYDNFSLV